MGFIKIINFVLNDDFIVILESFIDIKIGDASLNKNWSVNEALSTSTAAVFNLDLNRPSAGDNNLYYDTFEIDTYEEIVSELLIIFILV